MTYEEVKNLLRQLYDKKKKLKELRAFINEERIEMEGVGSIRYDSPSVVSTPQNAAEERYIKHLDRIMRFQKTYDDLFTQLTQEEDTLMKLMEALTPNEYRVILNRYMRGIPRREVANMMHYEESGIKDIQRCAIKKMSES